MRIRRKHIFIRAEAFLMYMPFVTLRQGAQFICCGNAVAAIGNDENTISIMTEQFIKSLMNGIFIRPGTGLTLKSAMPGMPINLLLPGSV